MDPAEPICCCTVEAFCTTRRGCAIATAAAGGALGLKAGGGGTPFIWQLGQSDPAGTPSSLAPQAPQNGIGSRPNRTRSRKQKTTLVVIQVYPYVDASCKVRTVVQNFSSSYDVIYYHYSNLLRSSRVGSSWVIVWPRPSVQTAETLSFTGTLSTKCRDP